jgi:DNA-binding transcriptional ArsR family regulator
MDAVARALADPTRRAILELVADDELTAGDIATRFDVTRPAISQHLRVLREADLVHVRREGSRRYYRAQPDSAAELRQWLDDFWSRGLVRLKREAEQEQWRNRADATGQERKGKRR